MGSERRPEFNPTLWDLRPIVLPLGLCLYLEREYEQDIRCCPNCRGKQNENSSLPAIGFLDAVVKVLGTKPGALCMSGKQLTTELLPRARQAADH